VLLCYTHEKLTGKKAIELSEKVKFTNGCGSRDLSSCVMSDVAQTIVNKTDVNNSSVCVVVLIIICYATLFNKHLVLHVKTRD